MVLVGRGDADAFAALYERHCTVKGRVRLGLKKLRNHLELREIASGWPPS
jgi:hypothetical protein